MYDQQTLTTSTYQNIIINSGWDYAVINNTTAVLHKLKHNQGSTWVYYTTLSIPSVFELCAGLGNYSIVNSVVLLVL